MALGPGTPLLNMNGTVFEDRPAWGSLEGMFGYRNILRIRELREDQGWLVIRTNGQAILDYLNLFPHGRPKARAIGINRSSGPVNDIPDQILAMSQRRSGVLFGRGIEDYRDGELPLFDVVTSINNTLFARRFDLALASELRWANEGGYYYGTWPAGLTELFDADGAPMTVAQYLALGQGFEVLEASGQRLILRRNADAIRLPELRIVRFWAGAPPRRIYQVRAQSGDH